MNVATSVSGRVLQQRETLRRRPDCRFLPPDEFSRLAISSEPLERADDAAGAVLGLRNPRTGTTFLVEAERIFGTPLTTA